jgi:uncharacterized membrane protein
LTSLDILRGIVMVLMAVDHSSGEFNAGRLFTDSARMYSPGSPLPAAQFLTRWITHLCAPSFVFLAGASLALYVHRREASGEKAWAIDRHIVLRGLIIAGFELWVSLFWMPFGHVLLQVLYAIGSSFVLMAALRRLPVAVLLGFAAAMFFFDEALIGALGWGPVDRTPLWAALLLVPGPRGHVIVAYPTLPWLAILLVGWSFGRVLTRRPGARATALGLTMAGAALLALFTVVRGHNGYGNMALLRDGAGAIQWLHVSKYPPSLSFVALELGLMAFCLAALWIPTAQGNARPDGLLIVLGRTPMFFYLFHIPCLVLAAHVLGVAGKLGLGATYLFAAAVIAILYPACRAYGRYKSAHPRSWTRYV